MKKYFSKQITEIKSNPKILIKKWYFWLIVIAIIYGLITDVFAPKENISSSNNDIKENIIIAEKNETEKAESVEEKESEEKIKKEKQKNIDDTKWTLYATTEQVINNRFKVLLNDRF